MYNLCYDLIDHILSFITKFEELYNILLINKYYISNFKNTFKNNYLNYRSQIYEKYPIFLINLFNNISKMREIEYVDYKDYFTGITGSIDNIKLSDTSNSISYCVDNFNNGFLILKLTFYINIYENNSSCNNEVRIFDSIISIYQKSNIYYRWCISSNEPFYALFFNNIINYNDIYKLTCLLKGESIKKNGCIIRIN
jgi:hypothetical protein